MNSTRIQQLTERKRKILRLYCQDVPTKIISRQLGITESCIATHISDAKRIMGTQTLTGLIAKFAVDEAIRRQHGRKGGQAA